MKTNETYNIVKSVIPGKHEVLVTYTDANGKEQQDFIFVNNKEGVSDAYYLKEAKKKFLKIKEKKANRFIVKKKPLLVALASLLVVGGIVTGITLGAVLSSGGTVAPKEDKFDKIKTYYRDYLMRTTNISNYQDLSVNEIMNHVYWYKDSDGKNVYTTLKTVKMNGVDTYYMDGVDYKNGRERDTWEAGSHVSQALAIAVTGAVRNKPEITNIAVGMTYYWVFNNFRSTNWWHNELGLGGSGLANLGLFTYDYLNEKGKALLVSKVANASFYYRPSLLTHAGTNLFDYADITLRSSIFTKNEEEFNTVLKRIEEEINDQHLEGFQSDGSYFQHGQQVQIASYGKGVIRLAKVLKALASADQHIAPEKMHIIERYILRGLRDMTHKGYINYSSVSREYVRTGNLKASNNSFSQFSELLDLEDFTRKDELKQYLSSIEKEESTFSGIEYFDRAHMAVANLDDLYISFKGTDSYLTNTECVNEENRLGLNLSYGTNTCVMDQGNEYYDIAPVWNYAYIPGTTSINLNDSTITGTIPQEDFAHPEYNDPALQAIARNNYYKDELFEQLLPEEGDGDVIYRGGVNDDTSETVIYSVQKSAHHTENNFLVTSILTKYGMVLLGADLSYDGSVTFNVESPKKPLFNTVRNLHTTIEQCLLSKKRVQPILSDDKKCLEYGNAVYKTLDDNEITVQVQDSESKRYEEGGVHHNKKINIKGGWGRNRNPTEAEKEKYVPGSTLVAYIDHGPTQAVVGGGEIKINKYNYAYCIQPKSLADNSNYSFDVVNNYDDDSNNPGYKVQELVITNESENKAIDIIVPFKTGTNDYHSNKCGDVKLERGEIYVGEVTLHQ